MTHSNLRCTFTHEVLTYDDLEYIAIVDEDIGRTVTNDAEAVIAFLRGTSHGLGSRPVVYRDTENTWHGLAHDGYGFTGYFAIGASKVTDAIAQIPTPEPASMGYDPRS